MVEESAGHADVVTLTGERTVPGIWHENYWLRRHEVVYEHVEGLVDQEGSTLGRAPVVLDAGCGEGYGTSILAAGDRQTVALDYDAWTAQHLTTHYPELPALRANLVGLPLREGSVDVLVSLQTIEHLWDQPRFVTECARVLRPGGLVVLSTPNRHTFPPGNVFHHRELDAGELAELLTPVFDAVEVLGVHHGPRLRAWERRYGGIVDAQLCRAPHEWSRDLATTVADIGTDDFEVDVEVATSIDLLATARAR